MSFATPNEESVKKSSKIGMLTLSKDCTFKGKKLYGKVQFVTSHPDIKIQYVDANADINVQMVTSSPTTCGKWQVVKSNADLKVQIVNSFPDIKVKLVKSKPGM